MIRLEPGARDYSQLSYRTQLVLVEICITGMESLACLIVRFHNIEYPKFTFPFNAILDHDLVADSANPDPKWRGALENQTGSPLSQLAILSDHLRRYRNSILLGDRAEYDRVKAVGQAWYKTLGYMT